MSDAKGPYKADEQALGGWLLDSREARIANLAHAAGRASRDGIRKALEQAKGLTPLKLLRDGWIHFGKCDCIICEALDADSEGAK